MKKSTIGITVILLMFTLLLTACNKEPEKPARPSTTSKSEVTTNVHEPAESEVATGGEVATDDEVATGGEVTTDDEVVTEGNAPEAHK